MRTDDAPLEEWTDPHVEVLARTRARAVELREVDRVILVRVARRLEMPETPVLADETADAAFVGGFFIRIRVLSGTAHCGRAITTGKA